MFQWKQVMPHGSLPSPYCTARNKRRMTIAEHQIDVCIVGLHSLHRCKRCKVSKHNDNDNYELKIQILKLARWHIYLQAYERRFPFQCESADGNNVTNRVRLIWWERLNKIYLLSDILVFNFTYSLATYFYFASLWASQNTANALYDNHYPAFVSRIVFYVDDGQENELDHGVNSTVSNKYREIFVLTLHVICTPLGGDDKYTIQ